MSLVKQRRRWINGTIAAYVWMLYKKPSLIWLHFNMSVWRKICFWWFCFTQGITWLRLVPSTLVSLPAYSYFFVFMAPAIFIVAFKIAVEKFPIPSEVKNQLQMPVWWLFVTVLYVLFSILSSYRHTEDWVCFLLLLYRLVLSLTVRRCTLACCWAWYSKCSLSSLSCGIWSSLAQIHRPLLWSTRPAKTYDNESFDCVFVIDSLSYLLILRWLCLPSTTTTSLHWALSLSTCWFRSLVHSLRNLSPSCTFCAVVSISSCSCQLWSACSDATLFATFLISLGVTEILRMSSDCLIDWLINLKCLVS